MDNRYVLKYTRVARKEEKRANRFHQWYIVLFHGYFKGTEMYDVERWLKVITEAPDTAYFPIEKPLIKIVNKIEVPL